MNLATVLIQQNKELILNILGACVIFMLKFNANNNAYIIIAINDTTVHFTYNIQIPIRGSSHVPLDT
jgi:hypothetical protein